MAEGRALPKKEADLFKSIVKFYETKQYKKGLKASDAVLKKFPNHGETLAMRGLVLNCLDKKTEAYDHVKRGLKADMRSHVCWHVYGLLYRSDRKYAEAIKSYKQALKIDSENIQILRDLSLLQVQLRDGKGFLETRRSLLSIKPNNKMHWIAYALANHLVGANKTAVQVIDSFMESAGGQNQQQQQQTPAANYEDSELALYRNSILEEDGDFEGALSHIESCKAAVLDGHAWRLKRAELRLFTERRYGSIDEWLRLMTHQAAGGDNYHFHRGLQCAVLEVAGAKARELLRTQSATATPTDVLALSDAQVQRLDGIYEALAECNPKSDAFAWLPLTYAPRDDRFEKKLDRVMRIFVRRGAPAFGSALERFWEVGTEEVKEGRARGVEACERCLALVEKHVSSLRSNRTFDSTYAEVPKSEEPPTTLLWALYLEAHCLEWLGRLEEALSVIEECTAHTPTAVDLYEKKASILKKQGRLAEAASEMDAARAIDLADRYINNKATKYLLRSGRVQDAKKTAALFTRHEGDPEQHLADMQATWYELELGAAHSRPVAPRGLGGDVEWPSKVFHRGRALKKLLAVEKHFSDFVEDQFDFHTYCVRKMTLRAYVSLLRFEETIRGHDVFCSAAVAASRVYLDIHDESVLLKEKQDEEERLKKERQNGVIADEATLKEDAAAAKAAKKLEKLKQRKAAKKEEAELEVRKKQEAADVAAASTDKKEEKVAPVVVVKDDDPEGLKLASLDGLTEALRLSSQLDQFAPLSAETHALSYDVAHRRGKRLIALRCLRRLKGCCSFTVSKAEKKKTKKQLLSKVKDAANDMLIIRLAHFASRFGDLPKDVIVDQVVAPEMNLLCEIEGASSLRACVSVLIDRRVAAETALPARVACARATATLGGCGEKAAQLILAASFTYPGSTRPLPVVALEDALAALEGDLKQPTSTVDAFKKLAQTKFPHAPAFRTTN